MPSCFSKKKAECVIEIEIYWKFLGVPLPLGEGERNTTVQPPLLS